MPVFDDPTRLTREEKGLEIDHDHWPAHHYRGRGNDQSRTGPDGPWLEHDAARFMRPPASRDAARSPRDRMLRIKRTDRRIYEDVCDALTVHADLDASDIEVRVDEGVVTLEGTVPSRFAKLLAEDESLSVRGVEDVVNALRVTAGGEGGATSDNTTYRPDRAYHVDRPDHG